MSAERAASALHWWREAGVDTIVGETPRDWLNPAPRPALAAAASTPTDPPLPASLDAFQAWLAAGDAFPLAEPGAPRVAPAGDPASGLMILIDMPSAADVAAGALLSGEPGELFDRMLAAIGRDRDSVYLAALSPARPAAGRIEPRELEPLARIARHHATLVAPAALLLFGDACGKALLGLAVGEGRGRWHELATPGGPIKTLLTIRPEKLLKQPNLKKHAWEDLKLLMEGLKG